MARPNYRNTDKTAKNGLFGGSIKNLFGAKTKDNEEKQEEDRESIQHQYEDMEEGFIKTKPREYFTPPFDNYSTTENNYQSPSMQNFSSVREEKKDEDIETKKGIVLSGSALFTAMITILILIGFAFLFGLIIGKGSTPQIAKVKPAKLEPKVKEEEKIVEVLAKEKLQFMTELKKEPDRRTAEQILADEAAEKKAKAERIARENKAKAEQKKSQEQEVNANKKYDYDIRVAAFRNEDQADKLRIKLETDGFRTRRNVKADDKGNWYYIHVLLIGTEERLRESRERFKKFGISDTIIESKTELK